VSKLIHEFHDTSGGLAEMAAYLVSKSEDTDRPLVTACSANATTPWYSIMMANPALGKNIQQLARSQRTVDILFDFASSYGFYTPLDTLLPLGAQPAADAIGMCKQLEQVWQLGLRQGYLGRRAPSGKVVNWPLNGSKVTHHRDGQPFVQRLFRPVCDCLALSKSHPPDQSWVSEETFLDLTAVYWGVHDMGPPRSGIGATVGGGGGGTAASTYAGT